MIRHAIFNGSVRAADGADNAVARVSGYGVVWGSRNSYGEIFVPGCFDETLAGYGDDKPLPMVDMHRQAIGRWETFDQDAIGLALDGPISDTAAGRDVATLLRDGAVNGLSVGFRPLQEYMAEPGETVSFDHAGGTFTSTSDRWTWYIVRAELVEVSVVYAPADDQARVLAVRSIAAEQVGTALPGLRAAAPWEDVAWSMCRLMGAPGAGLTDLEPTEREQLHARLAAAYERHGKTAPDFTPSPKYKDVGFQHDEPALYLDRSLGKRCSDVAATCGGISDRPLSEETRSRATEARDALDRLLNTEPPAPSDEPELDVTAVAAELQRVANLITT